MRRNRKVAWHALPPSTARSKFHRVARQIPSTCTCPHHESKPYFDLAHEGVLADRMFQSQIDESFTAHQYMIAAQSAWSVNLPTTGWGCGYGRHDWIQTITSDRRLNGPRIHPCYDYRTLGDELDKAKLSWRFYASTYGSASSGQGAAWSRLRSGTTHPLRSGLEEERHLAELDVHHRRTRRQTRERHVDHARLHRLRSRRLPQRGLRPIVGRRAGQYRRQEQVLELHRYFCAVGRLGWPLRPRPPAVPQPRRAGFRVCP